MTDLSQMSEEDITRWPEDSDCEFLIGDNADESFEGEDSHAQSV